MRPPTIFGLLLTFLGLAGCTAPHVAARGIESAPDLGSTLPQLPEGYESSMAHRDDITTAVAIANRVLGNWTPKLAPFLWPGNMEHVPDQDIPVLVAEHTGRSPCHVPSFRNMIIVDANYPQDFRTRFAASEFTDAFLSPTDMLSIMLLHEVGHIRAKHQMLPIQSDPRNDPNVEMTLQKQREQVADDFASMVIRDAMRDGNHPERRFAGATLARMLLICRENLATRRLKELRGKPEEKSLLALYADRGFTHTNTELRFVTMDHFVSMTADSGQHYTDLFNVREQLKHPNPPPSTTQPSGQETH